MGHFDKKQLKKLRQSLSPEGKQKIADDKECTPRFVRYVLRGEEPDTKGIIEMAIEIAQQEKKEKEKQQKQLTHKINSL